ncbi:MAG: ribonuclease HII [Candidatus Paceibacterota bacterium]
MTLSKIVGIDEVGRGPLAGPVTVCVASCDFKDYLRFKKDKNLPAFGKDSKKLTPILRQKYFKYLKKLSIDFSVVSVSNKIIDKKGISFSIKKAINEGLKKQKLNPKKCKILLDGGLYAPSEFLFQKTIIKGDEKEKIISWASIIAKVSRDNFMVKMHKKYPEYMFDRHKGYGTKIHKGVILKYGLSPIHRKSFCRR